MTAVIITGLAVLAIAMALDCLRAAVGKGH
jgi:hypothetical protein